MCLKIIWLHQTKLPSSMRTEDNFSFSLSIIKLIYLPEANPNTFDGLRSFAFCVKAE